MNQRELTGSWYLKKKSFGRMVIMVETIRTITCEVDFSPSPEYTSYEPAKDRDIVELGITVV